MNTAICGFFAFLVISMIVLLLLTETCEELTTGSRVRCEAKNVLNAVKKVLVSQRPIQIIPAQLLAKGNDKKPIASDY